jgi:hypothetical protein
MDRHFLSLAIGVARGNGSRDPVWSLVLCRIRPWAIRSSTTLAAAAASRV